MADGKGPTIALIGPLDTKRAEYVLFTQLLHDVCIKQDRRPEVLMLDVSTDKEYWSKQPQESGNIWTVHQPIDILRQANNDTDALSTLQRSQVNDLMREGCLKLLRQTHKEGKLHGICSIGGSQTTSLACSIMRDESFKIGLPKLAVTTMMSGGVADFIGESDILCMPSIVDISGRLNNISRTIIQNAASAMAGMAIAQLENEASAANERGTSDRPVVAISMFGLTTSCVQAAMELLDRAGYDSVVFHATGSGGRSMERLSSEQYFAGVLDLTTTELADEMLGGNLSAGPSRLTAASAACVPQVVSVGALDMCNFGGKASVPSEYADRKLFEHNAQVTLMRTSESENEALGKILVERIIEGRGRRRSRRTAPVRILFPLKGISGIDAEDAPFEGTEERKALLRGIRQARESANAPDMTIETIDAHINDEAFAKAAVERLVGLIQSR